MLPPARLPAGSPPLPTPTPSKVPLLPTLPTLPACPLQLLISKKSRRSREQAFVDYATVEQAQLAINSMDHAELPGLVKQPKCGGLVVSGRGPGGGGPGCCDGRCGTLRLPARVWWCASLRCCRAARLHARTHLQCWGHVITSRPMLGLSEPAPPSPCRLPR
jgi:hypothetical protein